MTKDLSATTLIGASIPMVWSDKPITKFLIDLIDF